jgi:hypothetical protein
MGRWRWTLTAGGIVLLVAGIAIVLILVVAADSAGEDRCHQAGGHWIHTKSNGEECWVGHKIKV